VGGQIFFAHSAESARKIIVPHFQNRGAAHGQGCGVSVIMPGKNCTVWNDEIQFLHTAGVSAIVIFVKDGRTG